MENKAELSKFSDFRISYSETKIDKATSIHHYHDTYEIVLFEKADLQIFIKTMNTKSVTVMYSSSMNLIYIISCITSHHI